MAGARYGRHRPWLNVLEVTMENAAAAPRKIHFVGSLPEDLNTPAKVMRFVQGCAGEYFDGVMPGGETGSGRARWYVRPIVERIGEHPAVESVYPGDWSSLNERSRYKLRKGRSLRDADLDRLLGYYTETRDAHSAFDDMRKSDPGLRFQAGIPSPFNMSFVIFDKQALAPYRRRSAAGERRWPYYRPFVEATAREISRIYHLLGEQVVIQLELAGETTLCAAVPPGADRVLADLLGRSVSKLVSQAPHGAHFGVHLCYGGLNNKPVIIPRSTAGAVALANAIARYWPTGRSLDFVHLPMADGTSPPLARKYYASLSRLALPPRTRLIAGISHPHQPLTEQRRALRLAEAAFGGRLDIAAPCGLGRYQNQNVVREVVEHAIAMAKSPS